MLVHAKRFWPEAITQMTWQFEFDEAITIENNFIIDDEGRAPLKKLTEISSLVSLRDRHARGCPVYALESKVQNHLRY